MLQTPDKLQNFNIKATILRRPGLQHVNFSTQIKYNRARLNPAWQGISCCYLITFLVQANLVQKTTLRILVPHSTRVA